MYLEKKRAALRHALKFEYMRKKHNPQTQQYMIFDSAMMRCVCVLNAERERKESGHGQVCNKFACFDFRWQALQMTEGQFINPTWLNFFKRVGFIGMPMAAFCYWQVNLRVSDIGYCIVEKMPF